MTLLLLLHHHRTLAVDIRGGRNIQRPEMINRTLEGVASGRKLEDQHPWKDRRNLGAFERIVIDEDKGTRIQLPLRRQLCDARRLRIPGNFPSGKILPPEHHLRTIEGQQDIARFVFAGQGQQHPALREFLQPALQSQPRRTEGDPFRPHLPHHPVPQRVVRIHDHRFAGRLEMHARRPHQGGAQRGEIFHRIRDATLQVAFGIMLIPDWIPFLHLIGSDHTDAGKTRKSPLALVIGHVETLPQGGIRFTLWRGGAQQHHTWSTGLFRKGLKGREQFQCHATDLIQPAFLRCSTVAQHILKSHQKKIHAAFPAHGWQRGIEKFLEKLVVSPEGNFRTAQSQRRQPEPQVFLQWLKRKRPRHSDLQWGGRGKGNGIAR